MSDGSGRAVELMLGMKNKEDFQSSGDLRVRLVLSISDVFVHHKEEVLDVTKVFIWLVNWQTKSMSVASSRQSWSTTQDSVDVLVSFPCFLVDVSTNVCWVGFWVESRHSGHESGHHTHRMRIVSESPNEGNDTIVIR